MIIIIIIIIIIMSYFCFCRRPCKGKLLGYSSCQDRDDGRSSECRSGWIKENKSKNKNGAFGYARNGATGCCEPLVLDVKRSQSLEPLGLLRLCPCYGVRVAAGGVSVSVSVSSGMVRARSSGY